MKVRAYITHKLSERYEDCQDAYYIDAANNSIAVSDGMSQSIFPRLWAELITESFAKDNSWNGSPNQIHELSQIWQEKVNDIQKAEKDKGNDPWMLENCINQRKGAGATLCGIRFAGYDWKGIVLGDTSLIEVSPENEIKSMLKSPEGEFNNHPDFFDSFEKGKGEPKEINGSMGDGDKILIVSDPIGELLFNKEKDGNAYDIIQSFLAIDNNDDFCSLVDELRTNNNMHNDDTTIIIIEYDGSDLINIDHQDNVQDLIETENQILEEQRLFEKRKKAEIEELMKQEELEQTEKNVPVKSDEEEKNNLQSSLKNEVIVEVKESSTHKTTTSKENEAPLTFNELWKKIENSLYSLKNTSGKKHRKSSIDKILSYIHQLLDLKE